MTVLFRLLGSMPLRFNHAIGAMLGFIAWWLSKRHRSLSQQNWALFTQSAGIPLAAHNSTAIMFEQGRGISELAIAWTAPIEKLYALVKQCDGWEHIEAAKKANRPIIFVTPHLGCFDIAGRYLESRIPVMALYREPKQAWLKPIMQAGRIRGGGSTARADAGGVRALLRTLKSGGNIIMLPDQVPGVGEGLWVPFFGKPAYTMTLLPRLAESTNAVVLFFFAERLPKGGGYHLYIEPPAAPFSADKMTAARQMNAMVEALIVNAPTQYLWGYNRYKHPAGAPLPPSTNIDTETETETDNNMNSSYEKL